MSNIIHYIQEGKEGKERVTKLNTLYQSSTHLAVKQICHRNDCFQHVAQARQSSSKHTYDCCIDPSVLPLNAGPGRGWSSDISAFIKIITKHDNE
eukprot:1161736-Pelagomonas_calceolata.AAC.4